MSTDFLWYCIQFLGVFSLILYTIMEIKLQMTRARVIQKQTYFILLSSSKQSSTHFGSSTPPEAQHFYSRPYRSCGVRAHITCGTHPRYITGSSVPAHMHGTNTRRRIVSYSQQNRAYRLQQRNIWMWKIWLQEPRKPWWLHSWWWAPWGEAVKLRFFWGG